MNVKKRNAFLVGIGVLCVLSLPLSAVAASPQSEDAGLMETLPDEGSAPDLDDLLSDNEGLSGEGGLSEGGEVDQSADSKESSEPGEPGVLEADLGTNIDSFIRQAIVDLVANEQEAYEISFLTPSNSRAAKTVSVDLEDASEEAEEYLQEYEDMVLERGDYYPESFERVSVSAERPPIVEISADGKTVEVVQSIWAEAIHPGMNPSNNDGPGYGDDHVLTFDAETGELLTLEVRDQEYYDDLAEMDEELLFDDSLLDDAAAYELLEEDSFVEAAPFAASYNRANAAAYAMKHSYNYNKSYRSFNSDCTNFVSQSMRAGGLGMLTGDGTKEDNRGWWYGAITQSHTWVNADRNFLMLTLTKRAVQKDRVSYLDIGDVIYYKVRPTTNKMKHAVFVTGKVGNKIRISAHTNNHRNVDFTKDFANNIKEDVAWFPMHLNY